MSSKRRYSLIILLLSLTPLVYFMGSMLFDFARDFAGLPKATKTYYHVFLPSKQHLIEPNQTYFSRMNKPAAGYRLTGTNYKLILFSLTLADTTDFRHLLKIHPEKRTFSTGVGYKGYDFGNATKGFGIIRKQPAIHTIQIYVNPKYERTEIEQGTDYNYYRLRGDLAISYNNDDDIAISIEPQNNTIPQVEVLCLRKQKQYYLVIGVGDTPSSESKTTFLKSLFLED